MANIYGSNYALEFNTFPKAHGDAGELNGKVRCLFDQVAAGAGSDTLVLGYIPAGARILRCSSVGGNSPVFSVAPAQKLAVDTQVTLVLGAAPTFPVSAFVEYITE